MNKYRKLTAILLIIVSIIMMSVPALALAATGKGEGEANLLQEDNFDIQSAKSVKLGTTESTAETVAEQIHQGLLSYSSEIDVSRLRISTADFDAYYSNVINDNPDLFFVSSSYQYYYSKTTNKVTAVVPQYALTQSEVETALEIFNAGAAKALKEVDSSMSDLQKALTVHDYICSYAIYPQIYDEEGYYVEELDLDIYHSAYGFFKDFTAVCAGYTLTYSYLMKQLGIECEYVAADDMEHAWNKVKINGNWYNVDVTYDNSDYVEAENTYGLAYHSCFLKSDAYFATEAALYHYNYMTYDDCTANDTTYDNAFWNDVNSRIYSIDGDFYYLNPDYDGYSATLTKRTAAGSETTLGRAYNSATLDITRYAQDSGGAWHLVDHDDILIRLLYLDGKFYVNDSSNIYAVTMNGLRRTAFANTGYLISLGSVDGNLVYQTYDDQSTVVVMDKKEYFRDNLTSYHIYPDTNNDGYINGRDWANIINS